jgi:hypothetical protein
MQQAAFMEKEKNMFKLRELTKRFFFALVFLLPFNFNTTIALAGSIIGWGDNNSYQATPPAGNNFIAIAAGCQHSLALKSDGSIVGWGLNGFGQATPPAGNNFIAIAVGYAHSLALKSDGSIVGWGLNNFGQATPTAGNNFIAIAAGDLHSLALKSDGSIVGWGDNDYGQATPPAGNNFFAIAACGSHSLALKSDGTIAAWGVNSYGEATPPPGNNFIAISAGGFHSLALKSDGSIVGWGGNDYGQATPPAGNNFIAIAAGWGYSLALKSDGSIVGWGNNYDSRATPPSGNNFIAISAGWYSLALESDTTPPPTFNITVNAPERVEMGTKYYIDVNIVPSESWQGRMVNLTVNEAKEWVHVDWDIHDNLYLDSGAWKLRPESLCYAWIWDTFQNRWIRKNDMPYYIGYEPASINIWVPGVLTTHCRFEAYHKWYWVRPWDTDRVMRIIGEKMLGLIDPDIPLMMLVDKFCTALEGQREISYTYTAQVLDNINSDSTIVTITPIQRVLMGTCLGLSIDATLATASLQPELEGLFIVSSEGYYKAASDPPDFNYIEIAVPYAPEISDINQIVDPNLREATKSALKFAAYQGALLKSLERYDGAKIDGMQQYMVLQMGAAQFYSNRIFELFIELRNFWCPVSQTLPIPTPEQIQQIKQNLLQNGLPEIEVNILSAFGYDNEQMNEIANVMASLPDEWFTSPQTICSVLNLLVESASHNLKYVPGPDVSIIFPQSGQAVQNKVTLIAEINNQNVIDIVSFYLGEPNNENGIPTSYQEFPATFDINSGFWKYSLDTTQLPDGYYVVLAKAVDSHGNIGWSQIVPFSIRNWAMIKLLPATENSKAGRTMPVKFSIQIAPAVDPATPFVYNDDLEIRIYKSGAPSVILQSSRFGTGSTDYRIDLVAEKYITNFKTLTKPATYVVEIWRPAKNFKVGSFTFSTTK